MVELLLLVALGCVEIDLFCWEGPPLLLLLPRLVEEIFSKTEVEVEEALSDTFPVATTDDDVVVVIVDAIAICEDGIVFRSSL